jgi:release factor glutamine methyltransferase
MFDGHRLSLHGTIVLIGFATVIALRELDLGSSQSHSIKMSLAHQEESWLLQKHGGERTENFLNDLARLQNGEPLAFILGYIPFLNTTIYLDSRPLIPRVETEYWVAEAIKTIGASGISEPKVLDLCAGSGCIGVAVAHALPRSVVHFAEIDESHHPTIEKNVYRNGIDAVRTKIVGGHLLERTEPPYDFILSNPPYIRNESEHVAESVKKFEPPLALYGGEDGTDLISEIIRAVPRYLTLAGVLFIEHEPEQEETIARIAQETGMHAETQKDQYGVSRYSLIRMAQ